MESSQKAEKCYELMGEAHRSSASSLSPSSWRGRKLEHKLAIPYSLEKEREQWGESEPWTILRATSKTGRAAQIRDEGEGERRRWREAGVGEHGEGDPDTEGNVETGVGGETEGQNEGGWDVEILKHFLIWEPLQWCPPAARQGFNQRFLHDFMNSELLCFFTFQDL